MFSPCLLCTFSIFVLATHEAPSSPALAHLYLPVAHSVQGEIAAGAQESAKKSAAEKLSLQERVWIASKFYALIQVYFAHWEGAPKLELDKRYREYLDKVLQSHSLTDFHLLVMAFVCHL